MISPNYARKIIEEFRFFDDLDPEVRKALREANYQWNSVEIMNEQHSYYQNGLTMGDLADRIQRKDQDLFNSRTKEKLRNLDESSTGNS